MPLCHQCKHQREIDKLRAICSACPGASDNFGGCVHLDTSTAVSQWCVQHTAPDYCRAPSARSIIDGVTPEARDALLAALAAFSTMTDCEAVTICRLMRGERLIEISRALGISKQAVQNRWRKIVTKAPVFHSLKNGLIGKRRGATKADREAVAARRAQAALDMGITSHRCEDRSGGVLAAATVTPGM